MPSYSWSLNGEDYHDDCDTPEEAALCGAIKAYNNEGAEPGTTVTVCVGEAKQPLEYLREWHARIGGLIEERVDEMLSDEIYSEDNLLDLSPEQRTELGQAVVGWLADNADFHAWGIKNVQEHRVVVPKEDPHG